MRTYGDTDIGRNRNVNQDYIFYSDMPIGMCPNLYIVADGMGGYNAGDYASSYSVERFVELLKSKKESHMVLAMQEAIEQINRELYEKATNEEEYRGMGTTFVACAICGTDLFVMNVGDSRLYVIGEKLNQITMDHSLVEELVRKGGMDRKEARNNPNRNIITRAVGAEPVVVPDFFEVSLQRKDRILLCSDGLTNMVDEDEIMEIIAEQKAPEAIVHNLVERANFYGGRDNISAIFITQEQSEVKRC